MTVAGYFRQLAFGLLGSVVVGVLVTTICNLAISHGHGLPFEGGWNEYSPIISAPFALLSLLSIRKLWPWVAGICATVAFWGYVYLPDAVQVGGGANIGFGLLLPFSPLFVFGVALFGLLPESSRDDR